MKSSKIFSKRLTAVVVGTAIIMSILVGCADENVEATGTDTKFTERTLKFGHVRPEGSSTDKDAIAFMSAITDGTEGNLKFDVYPNSQLGDYSLVQERLGIGDVEMQLAPAAPNINVAITIGSLPYLAGTWNEAKEKFANGSKLYTSIGEMFAEENIKMLAGYPKYFGSIITVKEPNAPGDPSVNKNIKIRVPGIKSFELVATSLGYQGSPIAFSEAFTSIQTGIVDGAIGSGAEGYYSSFRDVTKYYLPVNSHFEIWWLQMSMETWNKLSDSEKSVIEAAAAKFEQDRWAVAPDEEQEYIDLLEEAGAKIYTFTEEEYAKMAEKAREEVWPKLREDYGAELFDEITK